MPLVKSRPLTPGQRFLIRNKADVSKKKPEKKLTVSKHEKKGRNCYGRITSRRRGGGHKKHYRLIDFRRDKIDIPAKVQACLLYTSPSPRDVEESRMPSSA